MKHLIIIPGLGKLGWLYWLAAPFWWLHGYKVTIFHFDWDFNIDRFSENFKRLIRAIDHAEDNLFIVGASAGGVAALLTFAERPNKIAKIATIASPLIKLKPTINKTLAPGLDELKKMNFKSLSSKVISVFGQTDKLVQPAQSRLAGATLVSIKSKKHSHTIILGLTIKSSIIANFFKTL